MYLIPSEQQVKADPRARHLVDDLRAISGLFDSQQAHFYYKFPLYKDTDGNNILADALLVAPDLGVIAFALPLGSNTVQDLRANFDQVPAHIYSRLIRTKSLRSGLSTLIPAIHAAIILFDSEAKDSDLTEEIPVISSKEALADYLTTCRQSLLSNPVFEQLLATIDGAKGLIRPTPRPQPTASSGSKAKIAYLVDVAINDFDLHQKHGMYGSINGLTRIRGIAGSGKTVVLAMMAAIAHLRQPEAHILYTFNTKSLYQHVRRLITRFYRQFDDRDPNWDQIHVLHGWGGKANPGVYYNTCQQLGVEPLTFKNASLPALLAKTDPFDYACLQIETHKGLKTVYDYVLADEAQDFPSSFLRLCYHLAKDHRFVFAYDELQNIFQAAAPTIESIFGTTDGKPNVTLTEDVILRTCYRNPREVLVCSHAVGFGFYGTKMAQILEDRNHWESIGYEVVSGDFSEGNRIILNRPENTSFMVVSENATMDEIVQAHNFDNEDAEITFVCNSIVQDIQEGLKPEDIMVVSVDDRNARSYLRTIQARLIESSIQVNNVHEDTTSLKEFWLSGHVTLSTVHKAKGNEAYMVYVIGADAPMSRPNVRRRNILFTAMSRAKAWLRVTGQGDDAAMLCAEIVKAKENFPRLEFIHPGPDEIDIIKRDVAKSMDRKWRIQQVLSELVDLTEEDDQDSILEMIRQVDHRGPKKGKKKFGGSSRG